MDFRTNKLCKLLNIQYPIIQGGMIWNSGWELAAAVSNSGGLGIIGASSMSPDVLENQILKCRKSTNKPFAVNVALMYSGIGEHLRVIEKNRIKIVFTSAGNPKSWTAFLKKKGIIVVHVVSSLRFAEKALEAGVDAIVAEGFEAGGHNGSEETTTLCLVPLIARAMALPIIAAGGIATGEQILASLTLGASGVQIGSRFAASTEASSHPLFKEKITQTKEGETILTLKELGAVRLIKNEFYEKIEQAYKHCATIDQIKELAGHGRAKQGMFDGDLREGKLEIGQSAYLIDEVLSVHEIMKNLITELNIAYRKITNGL